MVGIPTPTIPTPIITTTSMARHTLTHTRVITIIIPFLPRFTCPVLVFMVSMKNVSAASSMAAGAGAASSAAAAEAVTAAGVEAAATAGVTAGEAQASV